MADGGAFKGSRQGGSDYFDDIMADNRVPAMFETAGNTGMAAYEAITQQQTEQGIHITMHCRPPGCGNQRGIDISWAELFVVANAPRTGILPEGWKKSNHNHMAYPDLRCSCSEPVVAMIPCDEAAKLCDQAFKSGVTSFEAIAGDRQVQAVRQKLQAQQQQRQPQQQQYGPPGPGQFQRR